MADADEADLKENRFSYLLQPIRDLAANWDINIAGELEEYLEELENLSFTIEGCAGPSLNFAEAALLIQVRAGSDQLQQAQLAILVSVLKNMKHIRQKQTYQQTPHGAVDVGC
jgi:condensin-2 complex subunit H2